MSAIIKAADPMTGGISCPPVEAMPLRRLQTRAIADFLHQRNGEGARCIYIGDRGAEMVPNSALEITPILAGPPRDLQA